MTDQSYTQLLAALQQLSGQARCIVAIDGRCGSGKTTLAARLQADLGCAVFHMDDFFPRPEQRTEARLSQPGENVDHERFLAEILLPLHQGLSPVTYRPYLCARQCLGHPVTVTPTPLTIVEGSYSCHPTLWPYYDLRVFLTVDPDKQSRRILRRSGPEKAAAFAQRWIPFEEMYFQAYKIQARCDLTIEG